jgi:regulatory protein
VAADLRTVTEIRGMRGSSRRTIYLDDEAWRAIASPVLRQLGLALGDVIDPSDIDARALAVEPEEARARAYRLLAYRERSSTELADTLLADGYPSSVVSELTEDLVRSGLVDDERFARMLAHSLVSVRGLGRQRALREMARKGVPDDLAMRELDECAPIPDERTRALNAATRAVRSSDSVDRLTARLVRRGFSFGDARDAAESAISDRADSAEPEGHL